MDLVEHIRKMREFIDDIYDTTEPHTKYESDCFLELNTITNEILGEAMALSLKLQNKEV